MTQEYWVVGGNFRDVTFNAIADGQSELYGPYPSYREALQSWRDRSSQSRSQATRRYSVVVTAAPVWQ